MSAPGQTLEEPLNPYRWLILVGLIMAAVMEVLDTTIVNVSLPQMAGNLGTTSEEIGWVSTGYILSNVVVLPMTAWLSSRFGRKNYLSGSILLFVIASFFCGSSSTLGALVFWRIVQGAGGAALLSTAQATLREIFPKEQQGIVQSIYVLGIIVAPTLGPTVGGWITDNYSWHWNFYINLPIGAVSLFLVYNFLSDSKFQTRNNKVDWLGVGLLAVGLGCLQYLLEEGNAKSWFESQLIINLAIVSLITLPTFIWWQLNPKNELPVVNLRVLKNRDLSAALVLFVALGFGLYGGVFIYPMFAQNVMGLTPTLTGMTLLPGGIMTGVGAILCGRLLSGAKPAFDPRIAIFAGFSIFVVSMWMMSALPSNASADNLFIPLILRGFGLGLLFVPINLAAFSSLKGAEIAQGSGLMNLCRQLGGSFGIAAIGSYVTRTVQNARAELVTNVYAGNPALTQKVNAISHGLIARGVPPANAPKAAMAAINGGLMKEAATIAYNSGFMMILAAALLTAPLIFILRKPQSAAAPVDAH